MWHRLSVLQCWRQPRVWPEQWPWPPGSGQGGSDPLWYSAHHVLRLNSWAHQRSTCNSSFFLFPNPLPVSLLVVSLHSYLIFRICTRAALGWGKNLLPPDVQQVFVLRNNQPANQRSHSSCLSNQQSSAVKPVRCFQYTKEDKNTSWAIIFLIFYLNVCTLVFVRYTERGSEVTRCVSAQLFGSPS